MSLFFGHSLRPAPVLLSFTLPYIFPLYHHLSNVELRGQLPADAVKVHKFRLAWTKSAGSLNKKKKKKPPHKGMNRWLAVTKDVKTILIQNDKAASPTTLKPSLLGARGYMQGTGGKICLYVTECSSC